LNLRSQQDISFELDFLAFLKAKGVPVSDPIKNNQDNYIAPISCPEGVRYGVLFNYAPGKGIRYKDEKGILAHAYGKHVASMHLAQKEFSTKHSRKLTLDKLIHEPMAKIPEFFGQHKQSLKLVQETAQFVLERFNELDDKQLTVGTCHGDLHCGNAYIDGDNKITFFDFDCCGQGWLEYDLAIYYWACLTINKKQRYDHFLAGYGSINNMPINKDSINLFIAMRQIWMLGLHADSIKLYGSVWYQQQYFDMTNGFFTEWKKKYLDNSL
jgi:Ser/Thr protein kinase RdoA (MazF antagonist)